MNTAIERLEALAEKATPRPWEVKVGQEHGDLGVLLNEYPEGIVATTPAAIPWVIRFDDDYGTDQWADADLVAAAINALPDLLAVARAAQVLDLGCERSERGLSHDRIDEVWMDCGVCPSCSLARALEPLFRQEDRP